MPLPIRPSTPVDNTQKFYAVSALGIEPVTAEELRALGAKEVVAESGGVSFQGDQETLYKACLWLRTATKIQKIIRSFPCTSPDELYKQVQRIRWERMLDVTKTLAMSVTIAGAAARQREHNDRTTRRGYNRGRQAPPSYAGRGADRHTDRPTDRFGKRPEPEKQGITHTHFAALRIKDAVVDRMRDCYGARPNIDPENPDVMIHAHFKNDRCTISMDAAGKSLHERGYRVADTPAPLKETLAAAILLMSDWDGTTPLFDPMCGSGTIAIEAALIATRTPPGFLRKRFSFENWPDFNVGLWERIRAEAMNNRLEKSPVRILGGDTDPNAIDAAYANAKAAGVENSIMFVVHNALDMLPPAGPLNASTAGAIVVNPPYGERLGEMESLRELYVALGDVWKQRFAGWNANVLTSDPQLGSAIGLHSKRRIRLFNGPLECRLFKFEMYEGSKVDSFAADAENEDAESMASGSGIRENSEESSSGICENSNV